MPEPITQPGTASLEASTSVDRPAPLGPGINLGELGELRRQNSARRKERFELERPAALIPVSLDGMLNHSQQISGSSREISLAGISVEVPAGSFHASQPLLLGLHLEQEGPPGRESSCGGLSSRSRARSFLVPTLADLPPTFSQQDRSCRALIRTSSRSHCPMLRSSMTPGPPRASCRKCSSTKRWSVRNAELSRRFVMRAASAARGESPTIVSSTTSRVLTSILFASLKPETGSSCVRNAD